MPRPTSDRRATERKHPWPMVRLGDVCEVVLGGTPKTGITEYWDGDIPWLTPGDMGKITQMYVDASNCKRKISQLGLDNGSTLCPARSVILSTRAPIGYAFVNSVPMATNQGCKTLVPSDDVYPEYLCFNLLGRTDELNELGTGTTFKELATGRLKAMALPLPPLSVQREIVARLERELAAVEKMKKGFEALAETAKAEFKAQLKEVFEEISRGGAETRRLGEVCERLSSGKNITAKRVSKIGEIPVYGANGLRGYTEEPNFEGECCVIGRQGALCGNVKYFKGMAYMSDHAVVAVFKPCCTARFMLYQLDVMNLGQLSTQAAQPGLSVKVLSEQDVFVPPLADQREVVSRLDSAKARAEKLEAKAREGVAVCETMRKAILKEAFDDGRASPAIGKVAGR